MGKLTDKVARGVFWVLLEKFGIQVAHFVVTLVLARLLTPNDYGTVALISVFVSFSNVLVDCGLPKALVQKKNAAQIDYDTVFYLSLSFSFVLFWMLFFAAPWVARFYRVPELCPMLRVLAVTLVFHGVNGVQNVELSRKMLFHVSFLISWPRVIVSSVVGVCLALAGYGAWALVWSTFLGGLTGMVARQFVIRWRPSLEFSWQSARELFSYGWKMAVAAIITDIYQNLYALIIGKFYTRADLAFVRKGGQVPRVFMNFVTQSLRRVTFPALVRFQDDITRLRHAMRRLIVCSSFALFPVVLVIGVLAEPMVVILFGEKWLPAVPYVRLTCFVGMFRPFNAINIQALTARGRSDIYLKLVMFRRVVGLVIMACTIRLGVYPFMAAVAFILGPLGVIVTILPNRRHLGYGILMQLRDVLPAFCCAFLAAAAILPIRFLSLSSWMELAVSLPTAAAVYLMLAWTFRMYALGEVANVFGRRLAARVPMFEPLVAVVLCRCAKNGDED